MEVKFKSRLQRRRPGAVASGGWEYEADQRHTDILMRDMGIDEGRKGVSTPGSNGEGGQDVKRDKNESRCRAIAAR